MFALNRISLEALAVNLVKLFAILVGWFMC